MSRLIVKNLPNIVTEEKLRCTFSSQGGFITDVQLKYTKDGKFRNFGFVGFQNKEDAERAQSYYHQTYLGTNKLDVQICADLGDGANKPRAWSKYSKDSSLYNEIHGEKKKSLEVQETRISKKEQKQREVDDLFAKYKDDPEFHEFMRIHKRNSEKWNNDFIIKVGKDYSPKEKIQTNDENDDDDENENDGVKNAEESSTKVADKKEISDLEYLKTLKPKKEPKNENYFTLKVIDLPYKAKKRDVKAFFKTSCKVKPKSIRVPRNIKGIAYVGFATERDLKLALSQNKSFLLGHQIRLVKYVDKNKVEIEKEKTRNWDNNDVSDETIAESGRLFVRNLAYTVTEDDIETLFVKYGPLTEINVPVDKLTRKVKGFAFVTYMIPENAVKAFSELDGTSFQGRLLHILPGKSKESDLEENDLDKLSFKDKKKLKEKALIASGINWNTLFLGSDAVADIMTENYNVTKKDVLLGDGKATAAVRLALGETQIVDSTRRFLEEQGVLLDAFGNNTPGIKSQRSKTVILAKNLPARTSVEEIRDMFSRFGALGRVVLPPNGITALVEFFESSEAKVAMRKLAYTKFRDAPLYLEFAPENTFKTPCPPPTTTTTTTTSEDQVVKETVSVEESGTPENDTTLFVKNLNFETTEDALKEHFNVVGEVYHVTISRKRDMKANTMLSMGYGFVQFWKKTSADAALKTLQHKKLDDHCLELKRSNRAASVETSKVRKSTVTNPESTKILIRNIPFEANKKEVEDLFKTFGELKFIRLPKKVTGSHRGFAFAEFNTVEDAKRAYEALRHSTHLYGRRLVLEWAAQEETLEDLRKKASREAENAENPKSSKRLKKSHLMEAIENAPKDDFS